MTYSKVLAANFGSGTWITYDSKLLNLEHVEVENGTSNTKHILKHFFVRQPVDPHASMERNAWMDQNKAGMAQHVSTIDTDYVKSKNQAPLITRSR